MAHTSALLSPPSSARPTTGHVEQAQVVVPIGCSSCCSRPEHVVCERYGHLLHMMTPLLMLQRVRSASALPLPFGIAYRRDGYMRWIAVCVLGDWTGRVMGRTSAPLASLQIYVGILRTKNVKRSTSRSAATAPRASSSRLSVCCCWSFSVFGPVAPVPPDPAGGRRGAVGAVRGPDGLPSSCQGLVLYIFSARQKAQRLR